MNKKQRRMVRLVAIVLAVLLAGSAVVSAILSFAYAEEALPLPANSCELTIEYMEETQALRMTQRLVYTNHSSVPLDRVVFYAPANLFRRLVSLPYGDDALPDVFPEGYLPGGIDMISIRVNGEDADWGFMGTDEAFLRVACSLAPGESVEFEFDCYLLLTRNAAFLGVSDDDVRLSDFCFTPASLDESGAFILNLPLSFTHWIDTPPMDVRCSVRLPEKWQLAGPGTKEIGATEGGSRLWTLRADGMRDFSLVFTRGMKEHSAETASGVQLRCLSDVRGADDVLSVLAQAIETCEAWFGPFPAAQVDVVQAGIHAPSLNHSACLWLSRDLIKEGGFPLEHAVRVFVARQYFGESAWAHPVSDAWLSDSICEYLAYLILEERDGHDAYLIALNENVVDSLQLTIPGGLTVTSDAALFTAYEYDIVVRNRGAAVFHELRVAMGREDLISGLALFHGLGGEKAVLGEMDLVCCLDAASGRSWEKFLTDWLFNIGDYVNQDIQWLD